MKFKQSVALKTCLFALLSVGLPLASAQDESSAQSAPDNTKVNQRDRSSSELTADNQKNGQSDKDITQQIRRAVVGDKTLSTYAHNIKIVSQNGAVTLKGPVASNEEKKAIESKAVAVVGQDKVVNKIEVRPQK